MSPEELAALMAGDTAPMNTRPAIDPEHDVPERFRGATLADFFDPRYGALLPAGALAAFLDGRIVNLWLAGAGGRGKTRAAWFLAAETRRQGGTALVITAEDLVASQRGLADDALLRRAKTCTLLVLDDLTRAAVNPFAVGVLTNLLSHRNPRGLRLVVTDNGLPATVPDSDPTYPLWSRLAEQMIVRPVGGPDRRIG